MRDLSLIIKAFYLLSVTQSTAIIGSDLSADKRHTLLIIRGVKIISGWNFNGEAKWMKQFGS